MLKANNRRLQQLRDKYYFIHTKDMTKLLLLFYCFQ